MPSIKIGNYLFTRLKQLGIQTVFGVPGGAPTAPSHLWR
jgi:TPP-dependent 2-oxoacid decarboxylase